MRRTLCVGLAIASLVAGVAACSSTPPPTPAPTAEAPTWDPRKDAIDQAEAIWDLQRPGAYAYTLQHAGATADQDAWRYRVSGLEGDTEIQHVSGPAQASDAGDRMSVAGLFDVAREGLADAGFTFDYDHLRGYPRSLAFASDGQASAAGSSVTVEDFTTAGEVGSANRARDALQALLTRERQRTDGAWEYTWSRIPAGSSAATPAVWTVHHDRKGTTAKEVSAGKDVRRDDVSLDGTTLAISNVLAGGGWVDVSMEDEPGFGVLIAVDPSPSVKGDAYWVRIAWTDLAVRAALTDVEAARARWATAQLTDYSYTWRFDGDGAPLSYKVSRKGAAATITPQGATPQPGAVSYAAPRVEDTFALIQAVLDQGGTVKATYDAQLGYPKRVELIPNGEAGAKGVITIAGLKRR